MKNGLAEDILGKRGAVGNCAHEEEKMKTSLAERRKAREGDEEEEEKENKETAPMKEGKAREWGATHIYFISLQTKTF